MKFYAHDSYRYVSTKQATRIPVEDPLQDTLVSFGGDGEPKSARSMLQTLIEFEEEIWV